MSAGSVKPGSEQRARLTARPMPDSSIPPHQSGTPWSRQRSWISRLAETPPTRPGFRLTLRHAPSRSARRTSATDLRLSSRQIGVESLRCSSTCPRRSSQSNGCSMHDKAETVELLETPQVVGGGGVGGVGVHLQHHLRPDELAHCCHDLDVPAGLHLELHPPVALAEPALDFGERRGDGGVDADALADGHGPADSGRLRGGRTAGMTGEEGGERYAGPGGLEAPEGRFDAGTGKGVAADRRHRPRHFERIRPGFEGDRQGPLADDRQAARGGVRAGRRDDRGRPPHPSPRRRRRLGGG